MATSRHALLSPSSSHRWLNCTPSARLEEKVEDQGSSFAEEGTCAHALCEIKLRDLMGYQPEPNEFEELKDKWYDKPMEDYTDEYVTLVYGKYLDAQKKDPNAILIIEKTLDFSSWIPESFGTCDAIIVSEGEIEVFDFKYGKGVEVSAVENPQMMIYALGAMADYDLEYNIKTVRMTIVQPRVSNFSEWEISMADLRKWATETLAVKARLAIMGEGEHQAGGWCKFCKIKARCSALANKMMACYTQNEVKELITDEQMGDILTLIPTIKTWCTAVEDYALAQALNGKHFKGHKLVEGRAIRKVTDSDTLIARLLDAGHSTSDIFKPAELRSLGDLEKVAGKKKFAELAKGCVEKPQGKPTLAPESDKRQEWNVSSAALDFKDIIV
jgi:hypothetical protein